MDWNKLESGRRAWQPNEPISEKSRAGATISRCLALTPLEPAVAGFISDGLSKADLKKLGEDCIHTLRLNILDEEKHELALTRAKTAMVDYNPSYEKEALELIQAWQDLPDPEIVKAAVLENSIFFLILPLYSLFGGTALSISSNSISSDERIHVASHRTAAQLLGIKPSKAMNSLRLETVRFIGADIDEEIGDRWTLERLYRNSDSLLKRGVSDLVETQASVVLAPYEINSQHFDKYS